MPSKTFAFKKYTNLEELRKKKISNYFTPSKIVSNGGGRTAIYPNFRSFGDTWQ